MGSEHCYQGRSRKLKKEFRIFSVSTHFTQLYRESVNRFGLKGAGIAGAEADTGAADDAFFWIMGKVLFAYCTGGAYFSAGAAVTAELIACSDVSLWKF